MKMEIQCAACFIKQAVKAARLSTDDFSLQLKAVKKAAEHISSMDPGRTPPEIATGIFKLIQSETGCPDAFAALKAKSNNRVKEILPSLKRASASAPCPFAARVKISLCGNMIDYGILDEINIEKLVEKEIKLNFLEKEINEIKRRVKRAQELVFVADNAGEIAFDAVLMEEFVKVNPLINIVIFLKRSPVINDATLEDARFFGIEKKFHIEETPSTVGLEEGGLSPRQQALMDNADVIIAKGQANYEILTEKKNSKIIYMLRAKCEVVARSLGVKEMSPVIFWE